MAWYNPFTWFSGSGNTRREGTQTSAPYSYSSEPAATVNFDTAMAVSAFWASARLLTETVAAMPIKSYRVGSDGSKQEDPNYPLWRLINFQPNRYQTRNEFLESIMLNLVTDGNAFTRVVKTGGRITSLLPLMSAQMQVFVTNSGAIEYIYRNFDNTVTTYTEDDIWHIKLFGNGVVGMSPLAYARNALGVSIAAEERVGTLAKNGGKPSGVLMVDKVLTPQQREAIRENMKEIASGDSDSLKILEADMKFQQIALSPQDMELLASRRYSLEDIARFMGVPSVLINDTAGSTVWGSGVEQIINGFYKLNLKPYLERIEASWKRWLMAPTDRTKRIMEFDFDSLLRADPKARAETNSIKINSAQATPNETRNAEGLPDAEGGDQIFINGALVPAQMANSNNNQGGNNENDQT
jgi:HK97 family phage portal protein